MSIKKTYFCRAKDERHRIVLEHIRGDCLEGTGLVIPEGARAVIDKNATPLVGDLVHCNNEFCCINGFIKQVQSVGEVITVGTAYTDKNKDYSFDALEMYGVVLMVIDNDGNVVYTRSAERRDKMNLMSVKDKFPETNAPVLCYVRSTATGNTAFTVGSCEKNEYWFLQSGVGTNSFPHHYWEVTHWQPLPEAPEAGE